MLAPEGLPTIAVAVPIGAALVAAGVAVGVWGAPLVVLGALVPTAALWAFRDPPRIPPPNADALLLAPADGTVVAIDEGREPCYLDGPARRVAIDLSPVGVHVTRLPATGIVEYAERVARSSHRLPRREGEMRRVGIRHASGVPVLVEASLVGGAGVALRDRVGVGERAGVAALASRVHVALPPDLPLDVALGQRTVAGETVLARLPATTRAARPIFVADHPLPEPV